MDFMIMEKLHMITLYTTPDCQICKQLAEKLSTLSISFQKKDMSDTEAFADIIMRYKYVMEAPLIEDNGTFIEKPDIEEWLKTVTKK